MMKWTIAMVIAMTGFASAAEGDVLLDIGPSGAFSDDSEVKSPAVGGSVALSWGFNDHTDFGGFLTANTAGGEVSGSKETVTMGIQSWLTPVAGDIRSQLGGRAGMTLRDGDGLIHLSLMARGLAELTPTVRAYLGGNAGANLGENGETFAGIDFGIQLRF
ncbi:MAG: hypothetical protein RL318_274 [Fibrobacterota bacterium]|jgi:hypothetical protein